MGTLSRNHRISVTQGMSGYFAVLMAEFSDDGGRNWCWEPDGTGFGRYRTSEEAELEAIDWAEAEDLPLEKWLEDKYASN